MLNQPPATRRYQRGVGAGRGGGGARRGVKGGVEGPMDLSACLCLSALPTPTLLE